MTGQRAESQAGKAPPALGERIWALRKAHGLTLAQLAEICGFSEATLSRIEHGHTAISAHHLMRIADHLGTDIAGFFRDGASPMTKGMRALTRAGEGDTERLARFDSEILGSDLSRKSMHPAINTVTARTLDDVGGLSAHAGEEFLYVLSGRIALHSELYAPTVLQAGDSLYFDGTTPHAYLNDGVAPARILVVVGPNGAAPE